jgi:calcium/calmodulin-dependent protein kinase (CaM kinase) II
MLVGRPAFSCARNERELYARIQGRKFDSTCPQFTRLSEQAKSLINAMLVVDPTKRLSATEALKHPWVNDPSAHASQEHLDDAQSGLLDQYNLKAKK